MISTKDFLVSAKNNLLTFGWVQGHLGSRYEGYCIMGAMDAVSEDLLENGTSDDDTWKQYLEAEKAVRDELLRRGMIGAIGTWNDADHRTQEDVLDLLDSAARNADGV